MNDLVRNIGIQSYCFRHFKTHAELIDLLGQCGASAIELSAVHVDVSDTGSADRIIPQYREAGIRIVSLGVQSLNGNEAHDRLSFEFARKADCKCISVHFEPETSPESWEIAERLTEEYGIPVAIHNHGGRHWLGSAQMLRHVFSRTSDRIGLCLDTAWALDSGEDPLKMADEFSERLYHLHIKDFIFNRNRKPEDVVIGTGNLDLPGLLAMLEQNDRVRTAVVEYEGDVEAPVPALKECMLQIRQHG